MCIRDSPPPKSSSVARARRQHGPEACSNLGRQAQGTCVWQGRARACGSPWGSPREAYPSMVSSKRLEILGAGLRTPTT
eukprot:8047815-Pyramimonas_sp.AAC.1